MYGGAGTEADLTQLPASRRLRGSGSAPALLASTAAGPGVDSRLNPLPERNHLLFPPNGPNRPVFREVLTEPWVKEFLGHERGPRGAVEPWSREAKDLALVEHTEYRRGLGDLLAQLETQQETRRREETRRLKIRKCEEKIRAEQERAAHFADNAAARPGWQIAVPQNYFQDPAVNSSPSKAGDKNDKIMGIYAEKETKPPHHEFDVGNGWKSSRTNEDNAENTLFGNKVRHGPVRPRKLGPTEEKYVERLEKNLVKMQAQIKEDELNRTDGRRRRKLIMENAGEFSCLQRGKKVWKEACASKLEAFSVPGPDPAGPNWSSGLAPFIEQPERTTSFERDFIAGNGERKSFWAGARPGAITGSASQADRAKFLLCPKGCRKAMLGTTSMPGLDAVPSGGYLKKDTRGGTPCRIAMPQVPAGTWKVMRSGI